MLQPRPIFVRALTLAAGLLILKVTASVLIGYRDYFPPNFRADFLLGRQAYFYGPYAWAFFAHLISGPLTLVLGLILLSDKFRLRFPRWHRTVGKLQVATVLLVLTPSGLWMARYAMTGTIAAAGFTALSLATATCIAFGWRSAVGRRFAEHRRWMWRTFLLLASAVVIRVIGGALTVADSSAMWTYPLSAWSSWLVPLAVFEFGRSLKERKKRAVISDGRHSPSTTFGLSLPPTEISARNSSISIS